MKCYRRLGYRNYRTMTSLILFVIVIFSAALALAAPQLNLTCDDCHTMPPVDSGLGKREPTTGAFKGNHQSHADATAGSCVKCHGTAAASYGAGHRNKSIDVQGNINNSPKPASYSRGFFNQTSVPPATLGNCSNVNCHFENTTPAWGSALFSGSSDCNQCHGAAPTAGHPVSGSKHGAYYGTGTGACVKCHPDHLAEAKPFAHATSVTGRGIKVAFTSAPNNGGSYSGPTNDFLPSQTNVFGSCSGIYCHSDGRSVSGPFTVNTVPTWGATLGCNGCHGGPATLGSPIATGKHAAHVNNSATLGANYGCVECHARTVSSDSQIGTIANHVNAFVDFSGAKAGKGYSAGSCSTTYCHSSGKKGGIASSIEPAAPSWSGAALDCKGCHGAQSTPTAGIAFNSAAGEPNYVSGGAGAVDANSHQKHVSTGAAACANCHSKTTANGTTLIAGGQHIDGFVNYTAGNGKTFGKVAGKSCSNISCHSGNGIVSSVGTAQWGGSLNCNGCHGGPAALGSNILATGKHTQHTNQAGVIGDNFGCADCHAKTVSSNTAISDTTKHMNAFVDYSGVKAGKSSTYSAGTCSATYCHSSGKKGVSGMAATVEPASPSWSGAALDCKGCHGAQVTPTAGVAFNSTAGEPNYVGGGAGAGNANSHQKHVTTGAASCANCHSKTTTSGSAIIAGSQHLDGFVNYTAGNGKSFGKLAAKTCSNISCHSGNGIIANVGNAQWGATLDCNGCHGGPAALGTNILASGKHTAHTNQASVLGDNLGCAECHSKTVSSNTAIADTTKHMNSFLDYSGVKAGKSSTYSAGTCSATYCHSSGKKGKSGMVATVEPAAPSWSGAALSCNGCHGAQVTPTAGVAFNSTAGEPNYVNGGAGAANANSHQKHVTTGAAACANCHSKTTATGTTLIAGNQHLDTFANYTAGNGKSFGKAINKSCSNISCHSGNGIVTNVANAQWGATLDCNGCHGGPAALGSNILASGKHTQHTNNAGVIGDNFGCADCHAKTVSSNSAISDATKHMNAFLDYSGVRAGKSSTYSAGNCSATYCHSSGKKGISGMVATIEPATPSWSGAALDCKGCHGAQLTPTAGVAFNSTAGEPNYVNGGAGASNANSHQKHVATGAAACANCHSKTTSNGTAIIAGSQHIDSFVNYTAGNGKSFGKLANKTCSNISCHSGNGIVANVGNAQWGAALNCNGCHGGPAALGSNILASGKHSAHVDNAAVLGTNYGCVQCHAKTVSSDSVIGDATKHLNSFLDYSGAKAGRSTTYSGGSCSATYCHTSGKKGLSGMVATVEPAAPSWSGAALGCNGCHGAQVTPTAGVAFNSVAGEPNYVSGAAGSNNANSHLKHVGASGSATCANCHSKTTANGTTLVAGGQHTDGFVNYTAGNGKSFGKAVNKTCSNISCHSGNGIVANVANAQWGATLDCNGCHGGPAALGSNIIVSGKHTQHTNNAAVIGDNLGCAECHAKTVSSNTAIGDATKHMNAFVDYSGSRAGNSATYSAGNCSASYCHSSGKKGQAGMVATVEPANPSWSGAALSCTGCHGAQVTPTAGVAFNSTAGEPNYVNGGAGAVNANSHQKHVGASGAATCAYCHSKTTSTGSSIVAGGQHMDRFVNYTAGNGKTFGKLANKTCSNISCHSGNGIIASVGNAQWGDTLNCNGCHGGPTALGSNILASGKHSAHINNAALLGSNYGCVECHAKTASSDSAIADTTKHGNAFVDYSGVKAGKSSTYSGGVCSASYCHSSGKKGQTGMVATVEPAAPSWSGGALTCKGCHGAQVTPTTGVAFNSVAGEPNYVNGGSGANNANTHQKHVKTDGAITCVNCHSATVDATGTAIVGSHTNKVVDVVSGGGNSFSYPGSKTCSNISCHSGAGFTAANAIWGSTLDCKGCHATLSGAHTRHIGTAWGSYGFYNFTANRSTGSDTDGVTWTPYAFGCANCHPVTTASHLDGVVEVEISQVTGGSFLRNQNSAAALVGSVGSSTVKCSNVYCHYNVTTPQWNQPFTAATRCSGCHENAPSSDSHATHKVAIHYDDIFTGTSGLMAASGAVGANAGHGDPAQSTTIGCNICHYNTVNVARNKYNSSCSTASCHGNTTGSNVDTTGAARITNLSFHVNGRNDVAFAPATIVKSKAQIRATGFASYTGGVAGWSSTSRVYKDGTASAYDKSKNNLSAVGGYSAGNCSNIACHNGVSVNWNTDFGGAQECLMCHTNM